MKHTLIQRLAALGMSLTLALGLTGCNTASLPDDLELGNTLVAVKAFQEQNGLEVDGIVGDDTLTAINIAGQRSLFVKIHNRRIEFVENIVKRDPSQARFLKGWKNRINSLTFSE